MTTILGRLGRWRPSFFGRRFQPDVRGAPRPVLLIVEGMNDAVFLKHVSRLSSALDPSLPNLTEWETSGSCLFVPAGGGDAAGWTERLAALGLPEFHLYDRELPPVTELRAARVERLNRRPRCRAYLTQKRSLENYLHPTAIRDVLGITLAIDDDTAVADTAARALHDRDHPELPRNALEFRAAKRRRERAKRLLNTRAAGRMTAELLAERDPAGEIAGWLRSIAELAALS